MAHRPMTAASRLPRSRLSATNLRDPAQVLTTTVAATGGAPNRRRSRRRRALTQGQNRSTGRRQQGVRRPVTAGRVLEQRHAVAAPRGQYRLDDAPTFLGGVATYRQGRVVVEHA